MSDSEDDFMENNMFPNDNNLFRGPGSHMNNFNSTAMSFRSNISSLNYKTSSNFLNMNSRSGSDQRSNYYRRETSPMSMKSVPDFGRPNFNNTFSRSEMNYPRSVMNGSVLNGRSRSPCSVRSTDSSVAANDIALAFKNMKFRSHELRIIKEAYRKYLKKHERRKIEKRRNLKLFLRGNKNSGYDPEADSSDSSLSDSGRSIRSTIPKENILGPSKSNRSEIVHFRKSLIESDMYNDCTEKIKQSTLKNLVNGTRSSQNTNHKVNNTISQKERFTRGTLLPSQRFNKSTSQPVLNGHSELPQTRVVPDIQCEIDDDNEEIFSQVNKSTLPQKRSLGSQEVLTSGNKRTKLSPENKSLPNASVANVTTDSDFTFKKPLLPVRIINKTKSNFISKSLEANNMSQTFSDLNETTSRMDSFKNLFSNRKISGFLNISNRLNKTTDNGINKTVDSDKNDMNIENEPCSNVLKNTSPSQQRGQEKENVKKTDEHCTTDKVVKEKVIKKTRTPSKIQEKALPQEKTTKNTDNRDKNDNKILSPIKKVTNKKSKACKNNANKQSSNKKTYEHNVETDKVQKEKVIKKTRTPPKKLEQESQQENASNNTESTNKNAKKILSPIKKVVATPKTCNKNANKQKMIKETTRTDNSLTNTITEKCISKSTLPLDGNIEIVKNIQNKKEAPTKPVNGASQTKISNTDKSSVKNNSEIPLSDSNVSMKPSFIKRKLFTQKLDIVEDKNLSMDSVNSPQAKSYKEKNKVRKLATSQSCLSRDIQGEGNNILDLIHKIVPADQINMTSTSNKRETRRSNLANEERWDVMSVISMCDGVESDTFTDEEIFKVNNKNNTKKNGIKEASKEKVPQKECNVVLEKLPIETVQEKQNNIITKCMPNRTGPNGAKSFWDIDSESDIENVRTPLRQRMCRGLGQDKVNADASITTKNNENRAPVRATALSDNTNIKTNVGSKKVTPQKSKTKLSTNTRQASVTRKENAAKRARDLADELKDISPIKKAEPILQDNRRNGKIQKKQIQKSNGIKSLDNTLNSSTSDNSITLRSLRIKNRRRSTSLSNNNLNYTVTKPKPALKPNTRSSPKNNKQKQSKESQKQTKNISLNSSRILPPRKAKEKKMDISKLL